MERCCEQCTEIRCYHTLNRAQVIAYLLTIAVTVGLDRLTKLYALHYFHGEYIVTPYMLFELVINRGISWGMLSSPNNLFFLLLATALLFITLMLCWYAYKRARAGYTIFAELLVISGSFSNIFDRVIYHGVIDFIIIHGSTWSWPVFNIADIAIVFGVLLMFMQIIRGPRAHE